MCAGFSKFMANGVAPGTGGDPTGGSGAPLATGGSGAPVATGVPGGTTTTGGSVSGNGTEPAS